jgi:hypothetical protein
VQQSKVQRQLTNYLEVSRWGDLRRSKCRLGILASPTGQDVTCGVVQLNTVRTDLGRVTPVRLSVPIAADGLPGYGCQGVFCFRGRGTAGQGRPPGPAAEAARLPCRSVLPGDRDGGVGSWDRRVPLSGPIA